MIYITEPLAVTAEKTSLSDADRRAWLELLGQVCDRFIWVCRVYCQMPNHYNIVAETPEDNLSKGMHQLNGVYTPNTSIIV